MSWNLKCAHPKFLAILEHHQCTFSQIKVPPKPHLSFSVCFPGIHETDMHYLESECTNFAGKRYFVLALFIHGNLVRAVHHRSRLASWLRDVSLLFSLVQQLISWDHWDRTSQNDYSGADSPGTYLQSLQTYVRKSRLSQPPKYWTDVDGQSKVLQLWYYHVHSTSEPGFQSCSIFLTSLSTASDHD